MKVKVSRNDGFDEDEVRKLLTFKKKHEEVIAKFLEILCQRDDAKEMLEAVRGGEAGDIPFCPECKRWMIWITVEEKRRWMCPDCTCQKFKAAVEKLLRERQARLA